MRHNGVWTPEPQVKWTLNKWNMLNWRMTASAVNNYLAIILPNREKVEWVLRME